MDGDSIRILILCICVVLSAYFSATETAFSAINTIRLKAQADDGDRRAAAGPGGCQPRSESGGASGGEPLRGPDL